MCQAISQIEQIPTAFDRGSNGKFRRLLCSVLAQIFSRSSHWRNSPLIPKYNRRQSYKTLTCVFRVTLRGNGDHIRERNFDLDKVTYQQEAKAVRVTDGSNWHLDLSEFPWM
jgi:hypothetical protein